MHRLQLLSLVSATLLSLYPSSLILHPFQAVLAQAPTPTSEERIKEAAYLNQEGNDDLQHGRSKEALEKFQKALAIFKEVGAKGGEGTALNNIGNLYLLTGDYPKAMGFFEQALAIFTAIGEKEYKGYTLAYLGDVYTNLYQYPKALEFYQKALPIYTELRNSNSGTYANFLQSIGSVHFRMGQYQKTLEFYQQLLPIYDRGITRAQVLNNLGVVYANLGQYAQALESYQQALKIATEVGNCYRKDPGSKLCYYGDEAAILNNLGAAYFNIAQYDKALELAERASAIYAKIGSSENKGEGSKEVQLLYKALGENAQSLESRSPGLAVRQQVGNAFNAESFYRVGEGVNLNNIGEIYYSQGKYDQALKLYQKALAIYKESSDKVGQGITLSNMGRVYDAQGQLAQALQFNQQALAIYKEVGDRTGEGVVLSNIGHVYAQQNQVNEAQKFYQQALAIHQEVGDKASEGTTLQELGSLLEKQQQPELAIVFYKQSVNATEAIRQNLRVLPKQQQLSYTQTVADRYRRLADLLLKQNRAAEAQQVLDLLKVQEIDDYLGGRGNSQPVSGNQKLPQPTAKLPEPERKAPLLQQEQQFSQKYAAIQEQAIALGKELSGLRKIPPESRSAGQKQRITELENIQQQLSAKFNEFVKTPDVASLVQQLNQTAEQQNLNLAYLNQLRGNLERLQQNAVLLYPLILEDRLELVLVTPDSPPLHKPVAVKRGELNQAIVAFRKALQDPSADAKTPARQLYDWLIKPIENELKQAKAQTIIYAPDGQLRYIPLGALHDGNQWLAQRLRIDNITAASLTDFNTKPQSKMRVLAAAFTQGSYNFQQGERQFAFSGLPFAGREVENLAAAVPSTTKLLDRAFNRAAAVPQMNDYNIVHLATHAAFVDGKPEDSFILFGDGDRVTLTDVANWSLRNVDLVVLSACETGLGGKLGNGEEILGFGYQMQKTGARAAIASLWSVSDGGTQALMSAFYAALQNGNITKAEALRLAQVALITGDYKVLGEKRGLGVQQVINNSVPPKVSASLNHPYYWAPFILIGNGL